VFSPNQLFESFHSSITSKFSCKSLLEYYIHFSNFQESQKTSFLRNHFADRIKTFCQNLRVISSIVLVLFKILYCCNSIFMNNILFGHGYATKYFIMNGIKKLKKLIYTNICMGNCKISKIVVIWIKSDFRLACGYFFVTGNHNKTENEILSYIKLY
jgi:hypothetical protein